MPEYLTIPVTLSKHGLCDGAEYRYTANAYPFVIGDMTYACGELVYVGFVGVHRAGLWHGEYRFTLASKMPPHTGSTEFVELLGFSADKEVDDGCDA